MPASNMASTPGPIISDGKAVIMSPFSGPKNSPLDARTITGWVIATGMPTYANAPDNVSTGALNTGIGFGSGHIIGLTAPQSIKDAGFTDDYNPGVSTPVPASAASSIFSAIGGGKSTACVNGIAPTVPYTAGFGLLGFGNGGSRDAGAGPVYTGFETKMVTATGTVANGAAVEAGWVNRTGISVVTGQSVFGSSTAASAVPA